MRLLVNGRSGRARRLAGILDRFPSVRLEEPATMEAMRASLAAALDRGDPRVIVAGGDGTVHQAARVLAGSPCALGIVPTGTGNDLAASLGIPRDPAAALRHAIEAPPRRIDLGKIDDVPYLGVLGVGIDGVVNDLVAGLPRWMPRNGVYAYAVVRTLWHFRPPTVRVEGDSEFEGEVMLAAVANTPRFGGGMRVAPAAEPDDGWLDLVIIEPFSRPAMLGILPRVYRGSHVNHPRVRTRRVRSVIVRCRPSTTFYADGEPVARADGAGARIEICPSALAVVAGEKRPPRGP